MEARLLAKSIQVRTNLSDLVESLGLEQYAQDSQGSKTEAARGMTPFLLIEQDEIRLHLDGESKSFGFAAIEITPEDRDKRPVLHFVTIDPGGVLHLVASRMPPPSVVELGPDALGDMDPAEQRSKELELSDRGEAGEG